MKLPRVCVIICTAWRLAGGKQDGFMHFSLFSFSLFFAWRKFEGCYGNHSDEERCVSVES